MNHGNDVRAGKTPAARGTRQRRPAPTEEGSMIGKIITALAGRSLARSIGGASAGPIGVVVGAALPAVLPRMARRLGPLGMAAAAVGGIAFARRAARRHAAREAAAASAGPTAKS